jgi:hypothetical protein
VYHTGRRKRKKRKKRKECGLLSHTETNTARWNGDKKEDNLVPQVASQTHANKVIISLLII